MYANEVIVLLPCRSVHGYWVALRGRPGGVTQVRAFTCLGISLFQAHFVFMQGWRNAGMHFQSPEQTYFQCYCILEMCLEKCQKQLYI